MYDRLVACEFYRQSRMHTPLIARSHLPLWIPVTLVAAFFQVWRTALQAQLRRDLSAGAASFARYLYAVPLDAVLLVLVSLWLPSPLPVPTPRFVLLCFAGGLAQITGTLLLIRSFGLRNFVVGTTYAKTEAAQLVLVSVVVFGVHLPALAVAGILVAVAGVLSLSLAGQRLRALDLLRASVQPAALSGLGAGFAFAITALALRAASLQLPAATPLVFRGLLLLLVTNVLQTLTQGAYMAAWHRASLRDCRLAWRRAAPIGILSALGSWAWFTGFSLTHVALVRGLGQIEIAFAFLFGHRFLKESMRWGEVLSVMIVVSGVLMILLASTG